MAVTIFLREFRMVTSLMSPSVPGQIYEDLPNCRLVGRYLLQHPIFKYSVYSVYVPGVPDSNKTTYAKIPV